MKKLDEASTKRMVNHSWKARRSSATTCWLILTKSKRTMVKPKTGRSQSLLLTHQTINTVGYFTSEPGATKALRYVAVPGRYEGCIPYKKGDKAWAT